MIKTEDWQQIPIYTMENDFLLVHLCPSIGNNVYRIWDKVKQREVLRVPSSPQQLQESPVHYGTPILIPPNRITKGAFRFQDRQYQLEINHPTGNHIHGLVKSAPWKVAVKAESNGEQMITSTLETKDHPDMMSQFPHDLLLEMTITLKGRSLIQSLRATNRGQEDAPFGYGLHTWFTLDGQPEKWSLHLPVESIWELNEVLTPTGRQLPLGDLSPLTQSTGKNLQGIDLDTVFFNGNHAAEAVLINEADGIEIRYAGSEPFRHWVIYTKGVASEWICLEPYTWVTDAPNLQLDPQLTGFRAIAAGDSLTMDMVLDIVHREA